MCRCEFHDHWHRTDYQPWSLKRLCMWWRTTDQKRLGDKSLWEIISWLDDCSSLVRPSIVWIYWLQSPLYLLCNSYGLMLSAQFYGFPWLVFWVMPLWPYDGPPRLIESFHTAVYKSEPTLIAFAPSMITGHTASGLWGTSILPWPPDRLSGCVA